LSALLSFLSAFTKEKSRKSNNVNYCHRHICFAFGFAIAIGYFISGWGILKLTLFRRQRPKNFD